MDKYARLDGFIVHPLDLFPKTHDVDDYKADEGANLDGFNIHPLDSFISHKKDPFNYLANQTVSNNDYNDLLNNINITSAYQDFKTNEYDQNTLNNLYPSKNNYINTDFSTNTTLDTNYNISSDNTYNYNTNSNNGIVYNNYSATTSTYNFGTIDKDYLKSNSYNDNVFTYKNIPSYTTTNYNGNYTKTYNTFPAYSSTNNISYDLFPSSKVINNGITYDKYISNSNNISYGKPYVFDILNSASSKNLYSSRSFPNYTQSYNYNVYPTSTITSISTTASKPNSTYAFPRYSKGFSLGTFTNYNGINSIKSTPDIFNKKSTIFISPGINSIDRGNLHHIRSYSAPRNYSKIRPPIVLPTKTQILPPKITNAIPQKTQPIIIPLSNHRKMKTTLTPIITNSYITSYESNGNGFVTHNINNATIPTIITHTSKPLRTLPRTITVKKLPPRIINVTGTNLF
jgi:hypothetical protein